MDHRDIGTDFISQVKAWDAVGNDFIFTHAKDGEIHFDYFGLTPEESSSGEYDGGPNQHRIISTELYQKVNEYFEKGKLATADQTTIRTMGTTVLHRTVNGVKDSYILAMRGIFTKELWLFLLSFKSEDISLCDDK
jgi:hypothetical protein